jgi:acetyl esterase/lipase
MSHMAELGWVCLSIDYRVAPNHAWPQHITDDRDRLGSGQRRQVRR